MYVYIRIRTGIRICILCKIKKQIKYKKSQEKE